MNLLLVIEVSEVATEAVPETPVVVTAVFEVGLLRLSNSADNFRTMLLVVVVLGDRTTGVEVIFEVVRSEDTNNYQN